MQEMNTAPIFDSRRNYPNPIFICGPKFHAMLTISAEEMKDVLYALFKKYEFAERKALLLANVHTQNTLYGVNSHGINRVARFIDYVKKGLVKIDAEAEKVESFGNLERWDGKQGPGIVNAVKCTDRAIALAKKEGMGLVALRNTNHWMRGGYYGWQAADENCIAILFTNTQANMPAWGGKGKPDWQQSLRCLDPEKRRTHCSGHGTFAILLW